MKNRWDREKQEREYFLNIKYVQICRYLWQFEVFGSFDKKGRYCDFRKNLLVLIKKRKILIAFKKRIM